MQQVARIGGLKFFRVGAVSSPRSNEGMTLVEVVVAMALIAIVMASAAQALGGFIIGMEMHRENTLGIQSCRSLMGEIREKRAEFTGSFPQGLIGWISQQNEAGWEAHLLVEHAAGSLDDHELLVEVTDLGGDPAGDGDNPVIVRVTSNWTGMHGRPRNSVLSTIMTDR